jgi:hypothetical protein
MQKKVILLATFINNEHLDNFLYKIYKTFGVKKQSVFLFETNDNQLILTYRLFLEFDQKLDIKKELTNTVQIHKKGTTFFTINSLNKLVEKEYNISKGNTDYSQYEIEWSKYENTMISLKNDVLEILPLNKKIIK